MSLEKVNGCHGSQESFLIGGIYELVVVVVITPTFIAVVRIIIIIMSQSL
jgi:hypothetical protein